MARDKDEDGKLSRRRTLQGMGAVVGTTALGGCGDDGQAAQDETSGGTSGGSTSGSDGSTSGSTGGSESGGETGPMGSACNDPGDLSADELLAPIETIVVVMMENRTFDHYLGARQLVEGLTVDGLTGNETNPDPNGNPVGVYPLDKWVIDDADPPHGWTASHAQFNGGAMDGFVRQYAEDGASDITLVMGYHVREQLPVYYALADNFLLCERWYASVMGPTWPNRFYLHLATSGGQMANEGVSGIPSIFDRLDDAGITNVYYNSNLPFTLTYGKTTGVEQIDNFFEAAAAGNLPQFCMVEPDLTALDNIGNDDHPPADIRMGQAFIASVYQALANSPQWDKCLLVIMYDEHGGFYDHVAPPTGFDELPEFEQLGFRVPALVVGPHVRRGCVSSTQFDHVSVIATATRKWGLEPLNERVTMTNDLSSAIDPLFVADPQPPAPLPPLEIRMPRTFTRDVPYLGGQVELFRLADRLVLPRHLDRRREHDRVMRRTLEWGARLGAVKIVG